MRKNRFYFFDDFFNFSSLDSLFDQVESTLYVSEKFESPKLDLEKLIKEEEIFDKGSFNLIVTSYKDADGKVVYTKRESKPKGWENIVEIKKLKAQMKGAIAEMNFEKAAELRDKIKQLESGKLGELTKEGEGKKEGE